MPEIYFINWALRDFIWVVNSLNISWNEKCVIFNNPNKIDKMVNFAFFEIENFSFTEIQNISILFIFVSMMKKLDVSNILVLVSVNFRKIGLVNIRMNWFLKFGESQIFQLSQLIAFSNRVVYLP